MVFLLNKALTHTYKHAEELETVNKQTADREDHIEKKPFPYQKNNKN